jgi:hypothetical protein
MSNASTTEGTLMSNRSAETEHEHRIAHAAVAASLGWSGWGSPVGLGILLTATGFFILCLHWAGIVH